MVKTWILGLGLLAAAFLSRGYVQTTQAKGIGEWRLSECRYQSLDKALWTPREERLTAECAVAKWGVPGGFDELDSIISCESGWSRLAWNPGGPYVGLAQHALSAWLSRVRAYGPVAWDRPVSDRWQNSRSALIVTVRMMNDQGLSPWSCA